MAKAVYKLRTAHGLLVLSKHSGTKQDTADEEHHKRRIGEQSEEVVRALTKGLRLHLQQQVDQRDEHADQKLQQRAGLHKNHETD
jgi:hypothetical protein